MEIITQSRRKVADTLKEATVSYFLKKGYSSFVELGLNSWGKLRGDVISLNLRGSIVLSEIKSNKHDYLLDKKWHLYLPYANQMYFVFIPEVFECLRHSMLDDLKIHGVGVLVLDPKTGYLRCVVRAKQKLMKKKVKRLLTIRMAWRQGVSKRNHRRSRKYV